MKHTLAKRLCLAAAALLLVGAFAFALAACNEKGGNTEEVTVSLILGDADAVSVTTDAPFLYDLLKEYCEENGLALEGSTSATGFYATRIGDLAEDAAAGEYIMFYHDIDDITLYTPGYDLERDGKTYFSASVGVSSLPLRDGATYLVTVMSFDNIGSLSLINDV